MKKSKKTLEQKLANREFKKPNPIIWFLLNIFVLKPFLVRRFNLKLERKVKLPKKGPAFIIYNHQSRGEYIWLSQAAWPRPVNFVVGYNEFFRKKFWFIFKLLNVIPKKNFTTDILSIKGISKIIKDNGVVCFSPEGMSSIVGHNQPIVNGTGKFLKHFNIPVYVLKIRGGYLTNHKVCLDDRRGRVDATFDLLLDKDKLASLEDTQIDDLINKEIWQDDYDWAKENRVRWIHYNRIAHHLNDICYKCPKCGKELTMVGEGKMLICTNCGNGAVLNDYYDFIPLDHKNYALKETPSKWADWEREEVIKEIRADSKYSYSVNCKLGVLPKYKPTTKNTTSEIVGSGLFSINHKGLHFKGIKEGKEFQFDLTYEQVWTLVIVTDVTFFSLYVKGEYLEFYPETPCVGKLLFLTEEMHRLHVNSWKNFPWFDYMYKSVENKEVASKTKTTSSKTAAKTTTPKKTIEK